MIEVCSSNFKACPL